MRKVLQNVPSFAEILALAFAVGDKRKELQAAFPLSAPRGKRHGDPFKIAAVNRARHSIIEEMRPFIARAKREGAKFYLAVQNKTFEPHELEAAWRGNHYVWGPEWWSLESVTPTGFTRTPLA